MFKFFYWLFIFFIIIGIFRFDTDYKNQNRIASHIQTTVSIKQFLNKMGALEGQRYNAINRFGYLGKYQFNPKTLRSININVPDTLFLRDSVLQDSAMILYMHKNKSELIPIINEFSNKYHNGIFITRASIFAGAHLVGSAGIWSYFYPNKFKYKTVDGNGVSVETYFKKFSNFNLVGI